MRAIAAIGLALLATTGATIVARAADLAYPPSPVFSEPDPQFEFGTGWYLRGDASFGPEDQTKVDAFGTLTTKQEWGWGAGGGVGYRFNSYFRADITGDYFDPQSTTTSSPGVVNGVAYNQATLKLQRYDGLVNGYFDLGNWYGLTPYVGAGAGIGVFNPSATVTTLPGTVTNLAPSSQTRFAWAAMAGVSYQVDPSIAVDLGYRYLDLGRFTTTLQGFSHEYTQQEIRVGVRYMLN